MKYEAKHETAQFSDIDEALFEVRSFLGRTVFIIDNVIQADFEPDEYDEAEGKNT